MGHEGAPARVHEGMVQALGLVVYVGAARTDATDEQVDRLRAEVLPYLRSPQYRVRGDEQPVLDMIHAIMGHDWVPGPEWRVQLRKLGRAPTGEVVRQ